MLSEAGPALTAQRAGRTRPARRVLPWVEGTALVVALVVPFALGERTDLVTLAPNVAILSLLAISFTFAGACRAS